MVETRATMTCPFCDKSYEVEMPIKYCFLRFTCPKCKKDIIPEKDDCCVFCSYADKKCPPKQLQKEKFDEFKRRFTTK